MNKLLRTGAVVALSLTLAVSALAGTLHSPGVVAPPPPPSEESATTTTDITTIILTVIGLIP